MIDCVRDSAMLNACAKSERRVRVWVASARPRSRPLGTAPILHTTFLDGENHMPLDGTEYEPAVRMPLEVRKTDQEAAEILRSAQKRISKPRHWTQRSYKRMALFSTKYCAIGAVFAEPVTVARRRALNVLAETVGGFSTVATVIIWNDQNHRTHAEVMDLFNKAIARCEKPKEND